MAPTKPRFIEGIERKIEMAWAEFPAFTSSNVATIKYEDVQSILEITFNNGGVYHYFDVPPQVADEFRRAESKGTFLAANIKGNFRYSKV